MRFLITFVLLSCFHFSTAFAVKRDAIAVGYKVANKATSFSEKTSTIAKKETHSLSREPFSESTERIHHSIQQHRLVVAIHFIYSYFDLKFIPENTPVDFKNKINYSYQFIFNCLFPKHTFW